MDREFNLISEPWIKVMKPDKSIEEIGLRQALVDSNEYLCLAGETKSQDFAILRLLLALMYTIFSRYDADGNEIDPTDDDYDPIEIWTEIYNAKKIPSAAVDKYFEKWGDRFWLFDEKYPFMQTKTLDKYDNTAYVSNSKLIGTLFESENKKRFFSDRFTDGRTLSYSEAARWLIHIISFDDTSAKKPVAPRETWLSQLGLVYIIGDNIFETIMLNYVADSDSQNSIYESIPSWESDTFDKKIINLVTSNEPKEKKLAIIERSRPNNQSELLSLRSRSILLERDNKNIIGAFLAAGEYFKDNDIQIENMTIWGKNEKTNSFFPRKHDASNKAWQEFGAISEISGSHNTTDAKKGLRAPGNILWQKRIPQKYRKEYTNVGIISLNYDNNMAHQVKDMFSDCLTFHSDLLTELGSIWRKHINDEIEKCEKAAKAVYSLSIDLQTSSGASGDKLSGSDAKMQFYDRIDRPFRLWLKSIEPSSRSFNDKCKELDDQLFNIAGRFGEDLAAQSGDNAVFGRYKKPDKDQKQVTSSALAINYFVGKIKRIFNKGDENNGG